MARVKMNDNAKYTKALQTTLGVVEGRIEELEREAVGVLQEQVRPFLRERCDDPAFTALSDAVEAILGNISTEKARHEEIRGWLAQASETSANGA